MRVFGNVSKAVVVVLVSASQASCLYGFAGGGLPPHIRTVAIMPFDNQTGEVALTQEVAEAVREAMEGRLGLRIAGEEQADAVITGVISRYEADRPLSFQQPGQGNLAVTRRLVQIVISLEIVDRIEDRTLWQSAGLRVEGEYEPPGEGEQKGRELALERLVVDLVDGAQSQW